MLAYNTVHVISVAAPTHDCCLHMERQGSGGHRLRGWEGDDGHMNARNAMDAMRPLPGLL